MSIRVTVLLLGVLFLSVYAWRDWYKSLCGLVLLTVFLEVPDMPRNVLGIQGLNPWNFLMLATLIPWLVRRHAQGLRWDMSGKVALLFGAYLAVVFVAYFRALVDISSFPATSKMTITRLTSDEITNPLKFMLPGIMIYDGCRTRSRFHLGIACILLVGLGYALLIMRALPLSGLFNDSDFMKHRHRINRDTGLDPNDLAMLLVGNFWAIMASVRLWKRWPVRIAAVGLAAVVFLGMALCHSRAAYVSFVGVGLLFGVFRWRPLLGILPAGLVVVCLLMPAIPARMGMGFGISDVAGEGAEDWNQITSGRMTNIWPPVFEQIPGSPLFGWGRRAMLRTAIYGKLMATDGVCPSHPHNAYLEVMLDSGLAGLVIVGALYAYLFVMAIRMGRFNDEPLTHAVSGMVLAIMGSLLITGLSAQSLFPTVSMMTMWCACGMLMRITHLWTQRLAALQAEASGHSDLPSKPILSAGGVS
jgi:O-antigen ligase